MGGTADATAATAVAGMAGQVVGAAIWAPSVHNTQPWWFTATPGEAAITLYADAERQLTVADPAGREMLISCGAALFNARLAIRSLGHLPQTQLLPNPAQPLLVARLSWASREPATEYERQLAAQVTSRRTHRGGFDPLPLSPRLLAVLAEGAVRDGAGLRIVTDAASRAVLAAAVQAAEDRLHADSAYVGELAAWVTPPGSSRTDGVPPTAYPARPEHTVPDFPGRDFAHGRRWGVPRFGSAAASRSAGVVCLLTTMRDRPLDWINAGQALQRILLTSASCGVAAAMHSQPVELAGPRELLRSQLTDGSYPQLVLRLGTVIQTATSVRRPVPSVLFASPQEHSAPMRDRPGRRPLKDAAFQPKLAAPATKGHPDATEQLPLRLF
jgi:hypothetical protein